MRNIQVKVYDIDTVRIDRKVFVSEKYSVIRTTVKITVDRKVYRKNYYNCLRKR